MADPMSERVLGSEYRFPVNLTTVSLLKKQPLQMAMSFANNKDKADGPVKF